MKGVEHCLKKKEAEDGLPQNSNSHMNRKSWSTCRHQAPFWRLYRCDLISSSWQHCGMWCYPYPTYQSRHEEGDGLPKVILEVSVGKIDKSSPSGVDWIAKSQSSGDGGSGLGRRIGMGSSSWMENYITQGHSLTYCPQNGYEFEGKPQGWKQMQWGPVAAWVFQMQSASKLHFWPHLPLSSSVGHRNQLAAYSYSSILSHALSLKTHSPLLPDPQGQFKISSLIWQRLLDANCIFGLSNFTFIFLN